ncbi:major facilitator superfamily domain-containing protein [Pisolithus sp. B1]|nr:major facilitator superfamily domain-containing protein [Pisolithus sp. B1]
MSKVSRSGFAEEVKGACPIQFDNHPERDSCTERRLRRKLDLRLVPMILLAMMSSMDRIAITFARLKGLQSDLHLTDVQYDTVIAVVYASYCPALVPSNMFVHHTTRPSIYIGCCVVIWGIISTLTGLTKDYDSIITCRVLLGLAEAAFYPGCSYLLSSWYTHKELGLRTTLMFTGGLMAHAFGSLCAAAVLGTMEGILHIAAWRWLFFIEGIFTVAVGILTMWLLPDYPHNTRWLSVEERNLAQLRLAKDVGEADIDSENASIFEGLRMAITDMKAYLFMFLAFSLSLSTSFTNFFPTLTATLGYSTTATLLMAAPPWVLPAIVGVVNAWHSDRTGERFFHSVIYCWISIIGLVISLSTMATAARYFAQYLMALSLSGMCSHWTGGTRNRLPFVLGGILLIAWVADAIPRPPGKRSVAIALTMGFGNAGTLVGSYIWKESWSPQYHPSFLICLCSLLATVVFAFIIRAMQRQENKHVEHLKIDGLDKDERQRIEKAAEMEGVTIDDALRRRKQLLNSY